MKALRIVRSRRSGFTLIELLVSAGLLGLIIGISLTVSQTSADAQRVDTLRNRVQTRARRALDRMAAELTNAGAATFFPDPGLLGTSDLVFQVATGAPGGVIAWGPPTRLRFQYAAGELDDGLDNNGNGLVDEGDLTLTRDDGGANEQTIVLCRGVRELLEGELANLADDNGNGLEDEAGFWVQRVGNLVTIRLSVEGATSEGEFVLKTFETSIRLRN